jgi:hypothetical protein
MRFPGFCRIFKSVLSIPSYRFTSANPKMRQHKKAAELMFN